MWPPRCTICPAGAEGPQWIHLSGLFLLPFSFHGLILPLFTGFNWKRFLNPQVGQERGQVESWSGFSLPGDKSLIIIKWKAHFRARGESRLVL